MELEKKSSGLRARVNECKSSEEVAELAKSVGVALTDEQLDVISGGGVWSSDDPIHTDSCPYCGDKIKYDSDVPGQYICLSCGKGWINLNENGYITTGGYLK